MYSFGVKLTKITRITFRPDHDVEILLGRAIKKSGKTASRIINSNLRNALSEFAGKKERSLGQVK